MPQTSDCPPFLTDAYDIDLDASQEAPFMDPRLYTSPEVYFLDIARVFPGNWILVADISDVPKAGDRSSRVVGPYTIGVERLADGGFRSWFQVQTDDASRLDSFPIDGGTAIVDIWERFVFVNLSGTAPPLDEYLVPIPDLLAGHDITSQHKIVAFKHRAQANWKLLVDNGFCDYHVPFVHSRLMPLIKGLDTWGQETGPYTTILTAPLSELGLDEQPPYPGIERVGLAERFLDTVAIGVYPNMLFLAFRTGAVHLISWWPTSLGVTDVYVQTYDHRLPSADDFRYGAASVEQLQLEDIEICESVQRGLQSRRYRPGPRHHLETRVMAFHRQYHRDLQAIVQRSSDGLLSVSS